MVGTLLIGVASPMNTASLWGVFAESGGSRSQNIVGFGPLRCPGSSRSRRQTAFSGMGDAARINGVKRQ